MIDKTSGVPAFRQVADDLRRKISAGEFEPGELIPSERDLVDRYGVSRPTVRDAIGLLRSEGVVIAEHGRGVRVRPRSRVVRLARSRLSRAAREADQGAFRGDAAVSGFAASSTVSVRFEPADADTAAALGIEPGTEVVVRDRVMMADGVPVQLAVSRLPRSVTEDTAIEQEQTGPGGTYARLEEAGHRLKHFEETVGARMPTPAENSVLQLPPGVPVITVTRVAYTVDGAAVEVNEMVLAADRYALGYVVQAD